MVTNYSIVKCDLEHYALSDTCIAFFKSLPPFSENGHLFLSIFEKRPPRVEILIHHHHHLFGIRPAYSRGVCDHYAAEYILYIFVFLIIKVCHRYTISG